MVVIKNALVLAGDSKYIKPLCVALGSVLTHASAPIHVLILDCGLGFHGRMKLANLARKLSPQSCVFFQALAQESLKGLPYSLEHLSPATFARLFAVENLPESVDRCLYLDSDILCTADITELFALEMEDFQIGAVADFQISCLGHIAGIPYATSLERAANMPFFNAGVLVIDCAKWRASNTTEKCLHCCNLYGDLVKSDQDVLNIVLAGSWSELLPRWNRQSCAVNLSSRSAEWLEAVSKTCLDSAINHYVGSMKPWNSGILAGSSRHYWAVIKKNKWLGHAEYWQWKLSHILYSLKNSKTLHRFRINYE